MQHCTLGLETEDWAWDPLSPGLGLTCQRGEDKERAIREGEVDRPHQPLHLWGPDLNGRPADLSLA
ncbi:hypothetical protein JZ751_029366 [Albula glossodonta]|uniref:Uncharacterized protein n=1 Tax=Albula glossodonta TaxID=121402 RepID=A0A8T2PHV3_9TELE|nr:hypothetical protein JZ751_029366 [Albula glossodonta]